MKYSKLFGLGALALGAGFLANCTKDSGDDDNGPGNTTGCVDSKNVLAAEITKDCELDAGVTYSLAGLTFVNEGVTLTIGAGVTVKGTADGSLSALVIRPGAKLNAVGTQDKPIVFTAGTSSPERGDFGGVVILGDADINLASANGEIEGLVGVPFGGSDDADNSGELRYVRIEYAGRLLGTDNELNGLTMGGVGSATKISYVQVYEGLDDCFEWFGGAVSASYLVASGCDDDMFDWDMGWRGSLQFALGVHTDITNADANGIEADNLNGNEGNTPRSAPKVANLTLIGNGKSSLNGMRLRRGTGGHIVNSIVTGFKAGAAVRVDGNTSIGLVNDGGLKGEALYVYGNGKEITVAAAAGLGDSAATVAKASTEIAKWFTSENAALGLTWKSPKPASTLTGAIDAPSGLASAKYLGAFDPSATDLWTKGWTIAEDGPAPVTSCLDAGNVLNAAISEDCNLPGDRSYNLGGLTFVDSGATLTLGAGAIIKGKSDGSISALVIQPGARIIAIGTSSKPIVFTAGTAAPERGDFGGLVLLGKADINLANETGEIEGLVGVPYGGANDADSSGVLQYVRIEYAGRLLGTDNELNGLTMGAVGSKTRISHVQVYEGLDDCFEWFGGAVSAKYLVATGCDDDMFDWDMGWRGTLQFAVGGHTELTNTDANGIEADNLNGNEGNTPRSAPQVANITLIGNGKSSLNGMRLRRGTGGEIVNAIVTGFKAGAAVRVDGNTSIGLVNNGGIKGEGVYIYDNGKEITVAAAAGLADSVATVAKAAQEISKWFAEDVAPLGISLDKPKPATEAAGAVDAPAGMVAAKYLGAFDPASSSLWTDGWAKSGTGVVVIPSTNCVEAGNKIAAEIDENCTIPGDRTYHLQGLTFVESGATLTIGAGATIKGKEDGSISALVVQPGAKINAIGAANNPIVFTAGTAAPERGDFGGVVILGKADINLANETGEIEGLVGVPYGGVNDTDNSGEIKYVRIEYAGRLLGTDNELNGLTMGGVGSKTKISYVQVYEGLDDCFEWFGGTVSATYLAAHGCDDDMFDWDMGWRGTLQFAVGGHTPLTNTDANGIEADNLNGNEGNMPRSAPKVANITLIGNGASSLNGMRLRRGTGGEITNAIVTGFKAGSAVRIDGNTSIGLVNTDGLKVDALYAYANGKKSTVSAAAGLADSAATVASTVTKLNTWFLADTATLGVTLASPKPTTAGSGAVDAPAGFAAAKYLGAFDPAGTTLWTEGWARND